MRHIASTFAIITMVLALARPAAAQDWRGMGRLSGKVTDDKGQPLEGVTVKLTLPASKGGPQGTTNKKGEWAIGGLALGNWDIDFTKEGFEARHISAPVQELTRTPPIEISLKPVVKTSGPSPEIQAQLAKAGDLMNRKQFAEARAIYEDLLVKFPQAYQLEPLIARAYYGENQFEKAIETLRQAITHDPANVELKLLLGNILVEKGNADEGKQLLASIDESQVKDPTIFVNVGIVLLNQNKPAEAVSYFDKAISRFPDDPDAYYFRGIANLQLQKNEPAKADLQKYVALAPAGDQAAMAKKILEQLGVKQP